MSELAWGDLPALQRDLLLTVVRLDRDGTRATREALTEELGHSTSIGPALEDLTGSAIAIDTSSPPTYTLTPTGNRLLTQHHARVSSVLSARTSPGTVAVPYCPHCDAAITLLSPLGDSTVRATPCGCHLEVSDDDSLYKTLTNALNLTADTDARTHLRQALQLAIARGEQ
ncbi:hypothetical protein [Halobaculum gomorrense]|nr:hypothetical protein [Halobaculum gomorrense]